MKIAVCVKQVPDSWAEKKMSGGVLDRYLLLATSCLLILQLLHLLAKVRGSPEFGNPVLEQVVRASAKFKVAPPILPSIQIEPK